MRNDFRTVVDDVQRDAMPARYDWNLTLEADLVEVKNLKGMGAEGDTHVKGLLFIGSGFLLMAGTTGNYYTNHYHFVYQWVTKTENSTVPKVCRSI